MSFEIIENKVVIDFDIDSTQVSKSGKTIVLASSNGFKWVDIDGVSVGINYNIVKGR
jgi:hypothetical protein